MSPTEQSIIEQFSYWRRAIGATAHPVEAEITVFIGCGTSYNLALSLAALANAAGRLAIAVPGGEWLGRRTVYWPRDIGSVHVVALSRSGETTETVSAAKASRAGGAFVTAITVEPESALARNCDAALIAETHPLEGIVMTSSASLIVLLGLQLIGHSIDPSLCGQAESLLEAGAGHLPGFVAERSRFVFLGGGAQYGIALEGALKLTEMSQNPTQAFHPLEYRHGPISLVDAETAAVMLYSHDQTDDEAKLTRELQDKGAFVLGLGGPGDVALPLDGPAELRGLTCLPLLQLLGQRAAESRDLDTSAPRHLTKVVTLA